MFARALRVAWFVSALAVAAHFVLAPRDVYRTNKASAAKCSLCAHLTTDIARFVTRTSARTRQRVVTIGDEEKLYEVRHRNSIRVVEMLNVT
jgi:hypothetical protein